MLFTSAMTGITACYSQRLTSRNLDLSLPGTDGRG
jgi:hypothetical protein